MQRFRTSVCWCGPSPAVAGRTHAVADEMDDVFPASLQESHNGEQSRQPAGVRLLRSTGS